jgi:microsomal dipeptidase-like Zn-dependent dipeptidase
VNIPKIIIGRPALIIPHPGPPRFGAPPAGTSAQPDLASVGPGSIAASLPAASVIVDGRPLVPLGGDYWWPSEFPLGEAYAVGPNDDWLVGPFVISDPVVTLRASVEASTTLVCDLWVYSPATLAPPWQPPAPAPPVNKPSGAGPGSPLVQQPQRPPVVGGTVSAGPGGGVLLPAITYTDAYGRAVLAGEPPYCQESAVQAVLNTCGPWSQMALDVSAFQGAAAYVRLHSVGSGRAFVNYLKQAAELPTGLDPTDPLPPVWGLADLHTHPMSFLGFGGHYISSPWAATSDDPRDMGSCAQDHSRGVADLSINQFPDGHQAAGRDGPPTFKTWPSMLEGIHSQMHPAWIRRAWQGGLRLMVALAVNNTMLADVHIPPGPVPDNPHDDADAIVRQLAFFRDVIAHNASWMELALTPQDARRIIAVGKLAVVFGVEVDSFLGQWTSEAALTEGAATPSQIHDTIKERLLELYKLGVRQLNPVHLTNNPFGGCSVYEEMFTFNNWWLNHEFLQAEQATDPAIDFRLETPLPWWAPLLASLAGPVVAGIVEGAVAAQPDYDAIVPGKGQQNERGANEQIAGPALDAMMELGLLIDVDHMGEKSTQFVLDHCAAAADASQDRPAYPVISAHTSFRAISPRRNWADRDHPWPPGQRKNSGYWPHESAKSDTTASAIVALGGMLAPITAQLETLQDTLLITDPAVPADCSGSAKSYAQGLRHAAALSPGRGVGIGTDMTLLAQTSPRFGPVAAYGLSREGPPSVPERRAQALAQRNGVVYRQPVSGSSRFFNPPDVDATGKLNPYLYPQAEGVSGDAKIGGEYAFANDIWKALWLHESGSAAGPGDSDDVRAMLQGFNTPVAEAATLNGLARTACELLGGVSLDHLTDPGDPADPRRQQRCVSDAAYMWWLMRSGANAPLERCIAGEYSFDFNVDGLAHYGLIPDLLQDLANVGLGATTIRAVFSSAETYIQTWEQCHAHNRLRLDSPLITEIKDPHAVVNPH